jgi:hypothetical protein
MSRFSGRWQNKDATMETTYDPFTNYSALITGINIEEAANVNAMYAADGNIYMHVPGDKLGALTVSGITFSAICDGETSKIKNRDPGLVRVLNWYRGHRISNPTWTEPIKVTLGNSTELEGYLGSFSSRTVDIVNHIHSFTLPLYLVPGAIDLFN